MEDLVNSPIILENPLYGKIGHFFVVLAFVSALLASIAYGLSFFKEDISWKKLGRSAFSVHCIAVLGIIITLFIMLFNHRFDYHYVWQHSSLDLEFKYILSCFWEGQEGSFLLWGFWHAVLGIVLIGTARKWEAPVLSFISLLQVFILSFLLGVYFLGTRIGNSPFLMIKDVLTADPVFLFDDYMRFIKDGTGLNALLQNYWMVIHPPVLFLGFAATAIPFAFALTSLFKREYGSWVKPALPYTLFAALILGTGILMGGAWAYEALSFGGFWAWDPVENASLVPWLVILGGFHTMLAYKSTGRALRSSYILIFLSFLFVIYSSFLTRSGVLGDTSVHSFVVSGLTNHLLVFLLFFSALAFIPLFRRWKAIPSPEGEESASSREFWMFIGALLFLFAGLQIILVTSVPAFNEFFKFLNGLLGVNLKTDWPVPVNPVAYYNSIHIWVAVLVGVLISLSQYFRYKKTTVKDLAKKTAIPSISALVLTVVMVLITDYQVLIPIEVDLKGAGFTFSAINHHLFLMFAAFWAFTGNLMYMFRVLSGKLNVSGASISHAGFGILLLGILISNARQEVISDNKQGFDYGENFDEQFKRENILLYRDMPMEMGDYLVTYLGDTSVNRSIFYKVNYQRTNKKSGKVTEDFTLYPYLLMDKKSEQLTPNPDTKHYLSKDIFTHVSSIPKEKPQQQDPNVTEHIVQIKDTIFYSLGYMILDEVKRYPEENDTLTASAVLKIFNAGDFRTAEAKFHIIGNRIEREAASLEDLMLDIYFSNIRPETSEFVITIVEKRAVNDWIIMKAIVFPFINLVWLGALILVFGFSISIRRRYLDNRRESSRQNKG